MRRKIVETIGAKKEFPRKNSTMREVLEQVTAAASPRPTQINRATNPQ
jgi:hypothetical protein